MQAYLFPGQGSQHPGMGRNLYEQSEQAKQLFEQANGILGFRITDVMFGGTGDNLKQTRVTQPAIFLHSVIRAIMLGGKFMPGMAAGHSLGEFSALVAAGALSFEDGLRLVSRRAFAMQKACEAAPSTMAAILGMENAVVEEICKSTGEVVVPANYNCPGQIVISGSVKGIEVAIEKLKAAGAKRAILLNVGGAFHSPLMEPAKQELAEAIAATTFSKPICPVYQNCTARSAVEPGEISANLTAQLTAPVLWTQTIRNMIAGGASGFTEIGPGKVLQGLVKKISREAEAVGIE